MSDFDHDVVIVGSGPSGLAAATALTRARIKDVVIYEREATIGGIPRHTHHPSFGLRVFKRPLTGPQFIRAMIRRCPDIRIENSTSVTAIQPGGKLDIATPSGMRITRARHIILATGARETPRHARLITGLRPMGVTTTGALQQLIYGSGLRPFERPVIVGTELTSFSALWTLRHAGIKPVAMIESNSRITAYAGATLLARMLGVPIYYNATITDISGSELLKQVSIFRPAAASKTIQCDGVIFSGCFVGENSVANASHLELTPDNRIPQVDQNWISSDPTVSVVGNCTHPADMGDQCYQEGLQAGEFVARLLTGKTRPAQTYVKIQHGVGIKMTTPSIVRVDNSAETRFDLYLHVSQAFSGTIQVRRGEQTLLQKTGRYQPAHRIKLRNIRLPTGSNGTEMPVEVLLSGHM